MGETAPEMGATGVEMLVPQQEMDAGTQDIGRGQGTLRALAHALSGAAPTQIGRTHPRQWASTPRLLHGGTGTIG